MIQATTRHQVHIIMSYFHAKIIMMWYLYAHVARVELEVFSNNPSMKLRVGKEILGQKWSILNLGKILKPFLVKFGKNWVPWHQKNNILGLGGSGLRFWSKCQIFMASFCLTFHHINPKTVCPNNPNNFSWGIFWKSTLFLQTYMKVFSLSQLKVGLVGLVLSYRP